MSQESVKTVVPLLTTDCFDENYSLQTVLS